MNIGRAMLFPRMNVSPLMVHAEQIEKNLKKVGKELKKVIVEDGNYSKTRFEVQDKPRFKRRFSNQVSFNVPRINKSKVLTTKPQEGKYGRSNIEKPISAKCDNKHVGKC